MKRVGEDRDFDAQVSYHTKAAYAANFTVEHPGRIQMAWKFVNEIIQREGKTGLTIVELGCGAGDISGPYSHDHDVTGVDVSIHAMTEVQKRFPEMTFVLGPVEVLSPIECDILILTEVLEHLVDPGKLVRAWLPKARYAVIGHPLDEPDPPHEPGHIWSYDKIDWEVWFTTGRHNSVKYETFPLGNWPEMILGYGKRAGE